MRVRFGDKVANVRMAFDAWRDWADRSLIRSLKNMTGDIAGEDCYDPALQGNREPLYIYRRDCRSWLLSDTALTPEEQAIAENTFGNRPRWLNDKIHEDLDRYTEELEESEREEAEEHVDE